MKYRKHHYLSGNYLKVQATELQHSKYGNHEIRFTDGEGFWPGHHSVTIFVATKTATNKPMIIFSDSIRKRPNILDPENLEVCPQRDSPGSIRDAFWWMTHQEPLYSSDSLKGDRDPEPILMKG